MTPEKQQPAVLFRKRLGKCAHTEPPRGLEKCLLVRPSSSIKLWRLKATLAPSTATLSLRPRFLLGLVQVAGFSSKREHYNMVEKHRIHFGLYLNSQQVFGQRYTHVTLMLGCMFWFWSVWTGCMCEFATVSCRDLKETHVLHRFFSSLPCSPCSDYCTDFTSVYNVKWSGVTDLWQTLPTSTTISKPVGTG